MGFRCDYEELGRYGTRLGDLSDEFRNMEDLVGGYAGFQGPVGHDGIADALGAFADNWSHKRGQLANALQELKEAATGAADGYCETDTGIARHIEADLPR